ncbi:putative protein kinase [Moumouvirus goulette]|uniref:Protein kinase domain-containing protein n=1 Tax=Moumouvirus goulette TaxID=1247379 RepID=M1PWQ7_9VIRU|nr:putative protein kinase [Moumouvirus goulette]AGF85192.1 putative protein kinase [Moumouvirus goulette]
MINLPNYFENINILSKKQNSTVLNGKLLDKDVIIKYYDIYSRSMFIELNILASCHHTNIVSLENIININDGPILMILEKLDTSLEKYISCPNFSLLDKYHILLQIAYGIKYLHTNNIIHFDIKPDNIMYKNNVLKIIDFGASEYILSKNIKTNHIKCTSTHRPPEAFYKKKLNTSCDIWSFGIIICELLSNCLVYENKYFLKYVKNINNDHSVYQFITSKKFSKIMNILPIKLRSCLDLNPKNRPNIESIIKKLHKLSNNYVYKNIFDNNMSLKYSKNYLPIKNIFNEIIQDHIVNSYSIVSLYIKLDLILRTGSSKNIIHTLINICDMVFNNKKINIDKIHINEIIIREKGILFQYHYYVYNLDNINSNITTLLNNYSPKSISLINNIGLINFD